MKRLMFAAALCISSAVCAQQPLATSSDSHASHGQEQQQRRLAMREHMGQLQLDLLVDSIITSDEQARDDTRPGDRQVASNGR